MQFVTFALATILSFGGILLDSKCTIITYVLIIILNACKKFGCKRIISVEAAAFWKSYFSRNSMRTEWPPNDRDCYKAKYTSYILNLARPKFHSILLYRQLLVFQIIEVFGFPTGYNSEFENFERKKYRSKSPPPQGTCSLINDQWEEKIFDLQNGQTNIVLI